MYAHNTAVPNRMIDIYSDSRMIAKEKKHPSRHFGKGVLITGAALVSAAALGVIGWCVFQSMNASPQPGSDAVYPANTVAAGVNISGKTYDEAKALLAARERDAIRPVTLTVQVGDETETLTQDSFSYSFNTDDILAHPSEEITLIAKATGSSVGKAAETIAEKYDCKPENASVAAFHPFAQERFEYHESHDGLSVDADDLASKIEQALESGNDLVVTSTRTVPAEITTESLQSSMVLLGSCETYTTTDTQDRINATHNMSVALGACNANNEILPGEIWSFNGCTGDSNLESNGYLPATVISNGQYANGVGGGICQASTTIYNAAMKANLKVIDRTAHKWASSYVPTGLDATIDYGYLDLKLQNTSDTPVYLECRLVDNTLYAAFWGVKSSEYDEVVLKNLDGADDADGAGYSVSTLREYYKDGEKVAEEALPDSHYDIDSSHGHSFNAANDC